jgi:hypothetical protein
VNEWRFGAHFSFYLRWWRYEAMYKNLLVMIKNIKSDALRHSYSDTLANIADMSSKTDRESCLRALGFVLKGDIANGR